MKHVSARSVLGALAALGVLAATPAFAASSDVTLATPSGTVYGTLDVPDGVKAPMPVALIIAGSGPTDRDGNTPLGVTSASYRLLAEALAARGIATLRYDKRGIAASAASLPKPASATQFTDYVDDAVGWVKQLRADKRFSRVALVGHSEGSLVALLAANRTPVDAVVSVSGSGRPLGDVIVEQIAAQGPAAAPLVEPARKAVAELKAGKAPTDLPAPLAQLFPAYLTTFLMQDFNARRGACAHGSARRRARHGGHPDHVGRRRAPTRRRSALDAHARPAHDAHAQGRDRRHACREHRDLHGRRRADRPDGRRRDREGDRRKALTTSARRKSTMHRPSLRVLAVAALVSVGALSRTAVLGASTGGMSGVVTAEGAPLANARVRVESPSQNATAVTDGSGRYEFLALAPDAYRVTMQKQGYETKVRADVEVTAEEETTVSFDTEPAVQSIGATR
jgi:pimeloyl-ACP methyl ester carboxylesterase